ncbi:hypothetical protein E4T44_05536 [Aureobasidium sp. EXF-8845]|nr:hypothetical protein E4T44_05536 [Aureobasidium sp. EXF-8845]KAI4852962.1 hypothetical protein E4T45_04520 [Aureobasidium sp. EXF-8846]
MGKATVILSSAFLAIGVFLFSYDSGIVGGVISFPQFIEYFNNPNSTVTGGIVAIFQGGAVLVTIINVVIADRLGRKRTIAAGSIVSLIGYVLQAATINMVMLMVGRFIAGAAVGPEIYKILGIDNSTSLMIIGISGSLSIVYCTIGLWALERFGRVKPLIISAAGLGAALVCNAAMSQILNPNSGNMLCAMIAMNFVWSHFYTPLGIISWVYPAEIFPVEIRAVGNATTTFTNWVLNLIFAQFRELGPCPKQSEVYDTTRFGGDKQS